MNDSIIFPPAEVITVTLKENGPFPNNPILPVMLYKTALHLQKNQPQKVEEVFTSNHWKRLWRNSIYPFHHYHSNTHEVLGIYSGNCSVQLGGEGGPIWKVEKGDVLIIPSGVSHKNIESSSDFHCVGGYPFDIEYDLFDGLQEKHVKVVPLPKTDPVYGKDGLLFQYWKAHG